MSRACEQELCGNWTGDAGCPCALFGIPPALTTAAAGEGTDVPLRLSALSHVSDLTDEEAEDWDNDPEVDPCDYCDHDNTRHAGDGCRDCPCAVPQ
jgi:hypothetical protein